MWPFKVQDSACLVHQGLTQSSYSINICSVNEEPFNNWEHIPLQSNRLWTHSEITSAFLPLQIQESEHKEGTLHQVKIPQWLWSLRLNIIFSSCLRVFRVPSFDQWSQRNLKEQKKKYEKTKSIYKLLWVLHKSMVKTWTFWYTDLPTAMFSTLLSFHP